MTEPTQPTPDVFDRMIGSLHGRPDTRASRAATLRSVQIFGRSQTFVIQTYREREVGDYVFVELVDGEGRARIVLPPAAAEAIARQRDALTTAGRRAHGREIGRRVADERRARGERPAFTRKGGRK